MDKERASKYLTWFQTPNYDKLKIIFESINEFSSTVCFDFMKDSIRIWGQSRCGTAIISFMVTPENIKATKSFYYCSPLFPSNTTIYIPSIQIGNAIKNGFNGDTVVISIPATEHTMGIQIHSSKHKERYMHSIEHETFDGEEGATFPRLKIKKAMTKVTVPSSNFSTHIKVINSRDPYHIVFSIANGNLVMCGVRKKVDVKITAKPLDFVANEDDDPTVVCNLNIFHIQKIAHAKNMSKNITMKLRSDWMCSFSYTTELGKLTFMVASVTSTNALPSNEEDYRSAIDGLVEVDNGNEEASSEIFGKKRKSTGNPPAKRKRVSSK